MTDRKDMELVERLKMEAAIHKQEARAANATIAEIYQAITGKTGEPGNWNGAGPVKEALRSRMEREKVLVEALEKIAAYKPRDLVPGDGYGQGYQNAGSFAASIARQALREQSNGK